MSITVFIAVGRPIGVGDLIQEAHHVVGADWAIAKPALGRRAIIEVVRIVDPKGHGESSRVLAEVFAGVAGADLRRTGIIEVWIGIVAISLRLDWLAVDQRKEHRLLLPDLAVEDAEQRVREWRHPAEADRKGPVGRQLVQPADLTPTEVGSEFVGEREADLVARFPFGTLLSREGEEDAEVLFAETADGDAGRNGIIADQIDRLTEDRAPCGVAFDSGGGYAGGLCRGSLADIDRERRATLALGLMLNRRTDARHALAPVGQGAGSMPFIDLWFGGQDNRRPDAGVKEPAGA